MNSQVDYPEIVDGIEPRHRFMSAYEQHIEPPDRKWQYLLFAAEPYETISFKLPSREIDKVSNGYRSRQTYYQYQQNSRRLIDYNFIQSDGKFWTHWIAETKQFFIQFHYKIEKGMDAAKKVSIFTWNLFKFL